MDSLKRWNQKASVDKTYRNLKIYMRKEYLDLQEVGGLTINNSSLSQANLVQELKEHQYELANNMKEQLTDNFVKTLQSMHMMVQDENQNPNIDFASHNEQTNVQNIGTTEQVNQ